MAESRVCRGSRWSGVFFGREIRRFARESKKRPGLLVSVKNRPGLCLFWDENWSGSMKICLLGFYTGLMAVRGLWLRFLGKSVWEWTMGRKKG